MRFEALLGSLLIGDAPAPVCLEVILPCGFPHAAFTDEEQDVSVQRSTDQVTKLHQSLFCSFAEKQNVTMNDDSALQSA